MYYESEGLVFGPRHVKSYLRGTYGHRRPRSDCASAQSDLGLRCTLTLTVEIDLLTNSKCPCQTTKMHRLVCAFFVYIAHNDLFSCSE